MSTSERPVRFGILGYLAQVARALTPAERRRALWMLVVIAALHLIGFVVFIAFVVPAHYKGLGIGVAGLAYSLGFATPSTPITSPRSTTPPAS
jgi:hypothetical protein